MANENDKVKKAVPAVRQGFQKVDLNRLMWRAKTSKTFLYGYLIGHDTKESSYKTEENPDGQFGAIIMKLAEPAVWLNKEGEKVEAEVGQQVFIVATEQLMDLVKLATMRDKCPLVELKFTGERPTKKGSMNLYDLQVQDRKFWASRESVAPSTLANFGELPNGVPDAPQLPAH